MGMGSRSGWSRSRAPSSKSTRARFIPLFTVSSRKAGCAREWKQSETGREAKFYSLTAAGRRQLMVEKDSWARLSDAVNLIFEEGRQ
jgi:hypothetical protein